MKRRAKYIVETKTTALDAPTDFCKNFRRGPSLPSGWLHAGPCHSGSKARSQEVSVYMALPALVCNSKKGTPTEHMHVPILHPRLGVAAWWQRYA